MLKKTIIRSIKTPLILIISYPAKTCAKLMTLLALTTNYSNTSYYMRPEGLGLQLVGGLAVARQRDSAHLPLKSSISRRNEHRYRMRRPCPTGCLLWRFGCRNIKGFIEGYGKGIFAWLPKMISVFQAFCY